MTARRAIPAWTMAASIAVVVCVAFFSPVLWTSRVFPSDGQYGAYAEHWSLWATEWAAGWPLVADTPSMASYPLRLALSGAGLPFDLFVLSAYVLTFAGTYAYANALALRRVAALTSAISFTFSGWMLAHLAHTSMIHAAAWLPWMLAAVERSMREPGRGRYVALLAVSTFMSIVAGHLQITVYALLLTGAYVLFRTIPSRRPIRNTAVLFAALASGIAASGIALLPTLELAPLTMRDALTPETLFQFSLTPRQALDLVIPFLHGINAQSFVRLPFFGRWNAGEVTGYSAHVTVALACIAVSCIRAPVKARAQCVFWILIALASYGLALGDSFTPGAWFTWLTPVLDKFRAPARHLFEFSFAVSVLAGIGLQAVQDRLLPRRFLAFAVPTVVFACFVAAAAFSYPAIRSEAAESGLVLPSFMALPAVRVAIVSMSLAVLAVWVAIGTRHTLRIPLLVALLLLQCSVFGYQMPWLATAPDAASLGEPSWADRYRLLIANDYRILGMDGYEKQFFGPELCRLYGVRTLGWYGPLILRRVSELSGVTNAGWTRRESLAANNRSLDVLSVRYVAVDAKDEPLLAAQPARWRRVEAVAENLVVYENLDAMPRSWVVGKTVYLRPYPALAAIASGGPFGEGTFDPRREAIVHAAADASERSSTVTANTRIVRDRGRNLWIDVDSSAAGWLIVSDAWYPGWIATVDGHPADVVRADYAVRAVAIPAGHSQVRMTYRPWSAVLGAVISLFGLLATLVLWRVVRRPATNDAVA